MALQSSRKFSSLNPQQVYTNFSVHLADCLLNPVSQLNLGTSDLQVRHLELKLATAKREAKFIEDQLKAIKTLDNIKQGLGIEQPKILSNVLSEIKEESQEILQESLPPMTKERTQVGKSFKDAQVGDTVLHKHFGC